MIGHPKLELLSRMLDRMLEARAQAALERHLDACSACRAKQQALARVTAALQDLSALEERVQPEPPAPRLMPVAARPSLLPIGIGVGIVVGILASGAVALWLPQPALRIVSGPQENWVASDEILRGRLPAGTALQTLPPAHADLELPGRLFLRLKAGTTMTWQATRPLGFLGRPRVVVNLMRGELLARTQEGFWGYRLEVRTPSASATVKGTAFSLAVDPQQDATTVKVLAGSLFFSPHLNGVGVNVGAGEMSWVQAQRLPRLPKRLAPADRKALLEAYRIGPDPLAALVIGGGPERVRELLQPPLMYLSMRDHPQLQFFLRKTINGLNRAILEGADLTLAETDRHLSVLEMALGDITDPELAVPLRLFAGAIAASRKEPERASRHFRWIVEKAPQHPLAPLALAAAGDFERLLSRYPGSPEAGLARRSLKRHKT